ncbi:ATPase inhibitor subunit zeta [Methylobacterium radiodurans]|uniref:DUF1476 domain-containing protein n=1 Tax=Methylobacterium radiodurans TaxID=2202828 RepID=A0A2U8VY34_9HYPH|nr:ATPase inhibitor subunit zeta [Methylobacterium radiodurans]AWN38271.1 DUF1476 domain-containing protein [Methylobacterium radiodurans]
MLKAFEDRERAAETLFARTEEARFAAHCGGIRVLAAFAMAKLGVDGRTAEAYARVLIAAMIEGQRDADLVERVRADLRANGIEVAPEELQSVMLRAAASQDGPALVPPTGGAPGASLGRR